MTNRKWTPFSLTINRLIVRNKNWIPFVRFNSGWVSTDKSLATQRKTCSIAEGDPRPIFRKRRSPEQESEEKMDHESGNCDHCSCFAVVIFIGYLLLSFLVLLSSKVLLNGNYRIRRLINLLLPIVSSFNSQKVEPDRQWEDEKKRVPFSDQKVAEEDDEMFNQMDN